MLFDPPRAGAEAQARALAAAGPPLVVAVSCNADSFARDARILIDGGYEIGPVAPLDQFRYSPHVEILAAFRRRPVKRRKRIAGVNDAFRLSRSTRADRRRRATCSPIPTSSPPTSKSRAGFSAAARIAVVRPGSTAEVSAVVSACAAAGVAIVPQGGNTGLVGGQIPDASGAELVLSLKRLNRIREVDVDADAMIVEAGVTLAEAQAAAEAVDRLFPLALASEGSCTIGGNLSTNAGGVAVLAYGNARDLTLGVEVVLADGRVANLLSKLRKDNTGYDLKDLFVGAEGTLGIVTAASLKLFARPRARSTAFVGLADPERALTLLQHGARALRPAGHQLRIDAAHRHGVRARLRPGRARSARRRASMVRADRGQRRRTKPASTTR